MNKKGLIAIILLLITVIIGLCAFIAYDKGLFGNKENHDSNAVISGKTESSTSQEDDIYGYAKLARSIDGSAKTIYKIVELHKNGEDKVLASYDSSNRNSADGLNRVGNMNIVEDKLYYQLYYSSESSGILTYSNIMYIDLKSDKKEPIELLNWKKDSDNYSSTLYEFKIIDDYVYFYTIDYDYYKYDKNSKDVTSITESEYKSVFQEVNNEAPVGRDLGRTVIYLNGKLLLMDTFVMKVTYDGETIYESDASNMYFSYSFDGDIIIHEVNCTLLECFEEKYYKYNFSDKLMQEISSSDLKESDTYVIEEIIYR